MPKYKFADIAINMTKKRKPTDDDMETYIGLEHLDTGNLAVTRWGSKVPIKGEKLIMEKGDILFGKRNAYLKRAAIAPHDGLFSAHGMILRPNEEVISPKLFPFFICSDYFFDSAIRISVGSLSPTINWSALKELEFTLPDMDEQEKLAELLWAANNTKEAYKKLILLTDELVKAQFIEMFGDPVNNKKGYSLGKVSEFTNVMTGATPNRKNHDYYGGTIPWVKTGEIDKGNITSAEEFITELAIKETNCKILPKDTVMIAMYGQGKTRGQAGILRIEAATNQACAAILPSEKLNPVFLHQLFVNEYDRLRGLGRGAQQANLNLSMIKNYPIMEVTLHQQEVFASFSKHNEKSKLELQQNIYNLEKTIKALMAKNFG